MADLREATDRIHPGLDYTKEILSTAHHDLGHTLVLTKNKRAVGMSILHLQSSREGKMGEDTAVAQVLTLHPANTNQKTFHYLLEESESLARLHGKRRISLAVNTQHPWAGEQALRSGYRVERTALRMILAGTDTGPSLDGHVDLSRWAG